MKRLRHAIRSLRRLSVWGSARPRAHAATGTAAVEVFVMTKAAGKRVIGTLSKEGGEFVFRYDRAFARATDAKPISAFPDMDVEYRSEDLWPFFAVRLPPIEREDVRRALESRRISESDVLTLLAVLSGRGVSSPYRFSMAARVH